MLKKGSEQRVINSSERKALRSVELEDSQFITAPIPNARLTGYRYSKFPFQKVWKRRFASDICIKSVSSVDRPMAYSYRDNCHHLQPVLLTTCQQNTSARANNRQHRAFIPKPSVIISHHLHLPPNVSVPTFWETEVSPSRLCKLLSL